MSDFGGLLHAANETIEGLRAEVSRLRAENERLRSEPCHYCEHVGWHEEDCPVLLQQAAGS